jgi:hypothetical protein
LAVNLGNILHPPVFEKRTHIVADFFGGSGSFNTMYSLTTIRIVICRTDLFFLLLLPDPQKAIQPLIELYFDVFVVSAHRAITPISIEFSLRLNLKLFMEKRGQTIKKCWIFSQKSYVAPI